MDGRINQWLVLAFALPMPLVHVVLGLANLHKVSLVWPTLTAMAVCLVVAAVLCWPAKNVTLPLAATLAVVAGIIMVELLVVSVLPYRIHPGYAAWQNGALQMLLVALTFRGRLRFAWLGMGLFAMLDFSASMIHGLSVVDALALVLTPIMWMVIATAVLAMLGRSRANIAVYTEQERSSARRLAGEEARSLYRDTMLVELDEQSRPVLETIAAGDLTEPQRTEIALLEAELRDRIRGRLLATAPILAAARGARLRGVKVDLLDDRETALPEAVEEELDRKLRSILDQAEAGVVRARALPPGQQPLVTILAFDEANEHNETYVEINDPTP